jgi:cleavage and polyadenylation specificity factor subunit 2
MTMMNGDELGSLKGYTLVAHRSGHTLGGSMYTLRPSLSSSLSPAASASSFLYAPIFNHIKEHHLDGAALLNGAKIDDNMRRMGVVVVGGERSKIINVKRVERDKALLGKLSHFSLSLSLSSYILIGY